MAGRRLLDAAKLFNAARSVAKQHWVLRSEQVDAFNKTSTVAKAVKDQTDRVTLTAQAAIALARRLNESESSNSASEWAQSSPTAAPQGRDGRSTEAPRATNGQEPIPSSSNGGTTLAPDTARRLQRESEAQIPSETSATDNVSLEGGLQSGIDGDIYYDRARSPNTDYSSLPRSKIPKHTEGATPQDNGVKGARINSDVFPIPTAEHKGMQEKKEDDERIPEGVDLNVFRTSRISKMLRPDHLRESQDAVNSNSERRGTSEIRASSNTSASQPTATANAQGELPSAGGEMPFQMRESRVPSSRIGRLWEYSGLATSMAFGAVGETLRRATGGEASGTSLVLSAANLERLVAKLSRMRGAALKLGQMVSFQDSKMLPAPIQEVLQRVQDNADYMPPYQRDRVLANDLGSDWREMFSNFEEIPIAAASIGQVHRAVFKATGQEVAIKVQYPGVAMSIDSDLSNLSVLLNASRLLPKGLFLDKTIANARTELAWECDYIREAECARRFKALLADDTEAFTVPAIINEASGKQVLTAEFMTGKAVTKLPNLDQSQRDWIGTQILRLCLREICEFKFMQTDPNWTNFLYNGQQNKIELLDFGASRDYPDEFVKLYAGVLLAASRDDHATVQELSIKLGYLTGHESKTMVEAHISSVLTLAEPFSKAAPEIYDFRDQTITDRVRGLIPIMMRERLAPPPEETYSLHRKLSGAFLLCAKLGSRVRCRDMFEKAIGNLDGKIAGTLPMSQS